MKGCSESCLSGEEPRKMFHFKKDSNGIKNEIYSSTEESVKEDNSMGKRDNLGKKSEYQKNEGLTFKKPREPRLSPKNIQSSFLSKKPSVNSEKVLHVRKNEKA